LGRWCSRGQLEGGRWRGEGVLGDVDVHGGVDVPALVRLLLPTRTASSPLLVAAVVVPVLGASVASQCGRAFPRLDTAVAHLLPPSHGMLTTEERENPNGGWGLGRLGRCPLLPLKPGAANVGAKAPICPGLDRPGGRGGACSLRANQDAGARNAGAKGEVPPRGRFDSRACAHRPLGVRASRTRRASHPARTRLRRGSPRAAASEAGERKEDDRDERSSDTWVPAVGERKERKG
jgi:hypothetical protein